MKTRISYACRNTVIELIADEGLKGSRNPDRKVLAAMTLFEGTGAWMLVDLRLKSFRRASAYSGSLLADDVHANIKPASEEEAVLIRKHLTEYTEDEDGIHWSTFNGLVRGTPRTTSEWLATNNRVGYFTRKEGLAYLKAAQSWWDAYAGPIADACLPNPYRQPSELHIQMMVFRHNEGLADLVA